MQQSTVISHSLKISFDVCYLFSKFQAKYTTYFQNDLRVNIHIFQQLHQEYLYFSNPFQKNAIQKLN